MTPLSFRLYILPLAFLGISCGSAKKKNPAAFEVIADVSKVYANYYAFAAIKTDGSVVAWGSTGNGGDCAYQCASVKNSVVEIYSTNSAFAALKSDGSVVAWGQND